MKEILVRGRVGLSVARDSLDRAMETIARTEPKVGRDQACPCGSGKKLKRRCRAATRAVT